MSPFDVEFSKSLQNPRQMAFYVSRRWEGDDVVDLQLDADFLSDFVVVM